MSLTCLEARPGVSLTCADVDPEAPGLAWLQREQAGAHTLVGDFLTLGFRRRDWIIGNPPYIDAEAHLRRALGLSRHVVFLLRSSFAHSEGRIPLWRDHDCHDHHEYDDHKKADKGEHF